MERLGIISGMYFLRDRFFMDYHEQVMENRYGRAKVYLRGAVVFLARHGNPEEGHILPHLINHQANMLAMKDLGVKEIFALSSTGSLKYHLKPGMFVVPEDFIMLDRAPSAMVTGGKEDHILPEISEKVRRDILVSAKAGGIDSVIDMGIYWQTSGPRLETKAEIRLMAQFADVVGMTMASEAVVAKEMGIAYASLCSIDNYAHGISAEELTLEKIYLSAQSHAETIMRIVNRYLEIKGQNKADTLSKSP